MAGRSLTDMSHLPSDRRPRRDGPRPRMGGGDSPSWLRWLLVAAAVVGVLFLLSDPLAPEPGEQLTFSQFIDRVEQGQVEKVTIDPEGRVDGEFEDGEQFTTVVPTALQQERLAETLRENDVDIDAVAPSTDGFVSILVSFLPFLLLIGLFWWFSRRARGQFSQLQGISKSRAKVIDTQRPDTRFDDVAGYEDVKREIAEVVDFLKDPSRYRAAGARGPGGLLLVGPPGTGKTLLARAVAGEADVPFIYATGSGFVEMLVGVGASRVRDLFEEADRKSVV